MANFIADCLTALICIFGIAGGIYLISMGSVISIISGLILLCLALAFTKGAFVDFNKQ